MTDLAGFTERDLFLDIETLGLKKEVHPIYLIGLGRLSPPDRFEITLLFAENRREEAALLAAFMEGLRDVDRLVTFNGTRFDLPYLKYRASWYSLPFDDSSFAHLDLLREARSVRHLLPVLSLSQKSLEHCLGLEREDTFSGGDLIEVYLNYESHPDEEKRRLLLLHNLEDVFGMTRLCRILQYRRLAQAGLTVRKTDYDAVENRLILYLSSDQPVPAPCRIRTDYCYLILRDSEIRGTVLLYNNALRLLLPNCKDYVFLTDEQICVPKQLAGSVPRDRKRPAAPEECFTEIKIDPHNPDETVIRDYVSRLFDQLI